MKDPVEIEQDATEWLKDAGLYALGVALGLLIVVLAVGFFGLLMGLAIRVARWAAGE